MASIWGELKRRNVVKVAVAYAIVSWLLLQVADTAAPALRLPEWTISFITLLLLLGFPLAIFLAWAFEMTPEGVKPTAEVDSTVSAANGARGKLSYGIIALLVLALAFVVVDQYVLKDDVAEVVKQPVQAETEATVTDATPTDLEAPDEILPNSVAVLPFENLSPNPDNAYFAAGIHESILTQLAKISDLSVIARTSVLQYENNPLPIQEIAGALNVELVMEGSVRYANDRVLISAQLIDGLTGAHVWSEEYNRDLADIFAVQAEIAQQIAIALEATLSPAEQQRIEKSLTNSPEALELYYKSLELRLPTALELEYLDRAISIDPDFARAYAQRARAYAAAIRAANREERIEIERLINQNAQRALELDPELGYAYVALANLHLLNFREDEAREAFERALELSPNDTEVLDSYAGFSSVTFDTAKAIELALRAVELSPGNADLYDALGDTYFVAHELDAAVDAYRKAIDLDPGHPGAERRLGHIEAIRRNVDAALVHLRRSEEFRSAGDPEAAYAYSLINHQDEARRIFDTFADITNPSSDNLNRVFLYLAIGDEEAALQALNKYIDSKFSSGWAFMGAAQLKTNVFKDPVLDKPEFVEARSRLGFH